MEFFFIVPFSWDQNVQEMMHFILVCEYKVILVLLVENSTLGPTTQKTVPFTETHKRTLHEDWS